MKEENNYIPPSGLEGVREKAQALVDALDRCKSVLDSAIVFQYYTHGGTGYSGPQYGAELDALRAALATSIPSEVTTGEPEISESLKRGIEQAVRGEGSEIDVASLPIDTDNTAIGTWSAIGSTEFRTSPPGGDGEGAFAVEPEDVASALRSGFISGFLRAIASTTDDWKQAEWLKQAEAALDSTPPLASRSTVDEEPVALWVGQAMNQGGGWMWDEEHSFDDERDRDEWVAERPGILESGTYRFVPLYRKPQQ